MSIDEIKSYLHKFIDECEDEELLEYMYQLLTNENGAWDMVLEQQRLIEESKNTT
ncbi:MAG: hypothetical protein KBG21_07415 [Ignavibacteria bacterium]|nr:hypothetical protein [Ignavibacteria bacterium]